MVGLALLMLVPLSGCKKSGPGSHRCDFERQQEAYNSAIIALFEDQTVANCERVKKTGVDYIRAVERCSGLIPSVVAGAREAVKAYEDLDCAVEFGDD